jgi:hypothetical protein
MDEPLRIFVVKKVYAEPVLAGDEQGAYDIFNNHFSDFNEYEEDLTEIKTLADLRRCDNVEEDSVPWGQRHGEKTIAELLAASEEALWATRVPEQIIDAALVGVAVAGLNYSAKDADVGRVIYCLADGRLRAESDAQRLERRLTVSDEVIGAEIKARYARKLAETFLAEFNRLYPTKKQED